MIHQNTDGIDADAKHYSCLFNVAVSSRDVLLSKPWTVDEYNAAWRRARLCGIISGDLNNDGDYDDAGEDEILRYQELFELLELPLVSVLPESLGLPLVKIDGVWRIAPTEEPLDASKYWVAEAWKWRIRHFVRGDGTGKKKAEWDPIHPFSLTRKNGAIESLRVFKISIRRT